MANAATLPRKEAPMAASAIKVTASLPSRFPKTPFTKAPKSGNRMIATSKTQSRSGKIASRVCMASVPQAVGFVRQDGRAQPMKGKDDREADRHLCGGDRDDEESEHLSPHVVGV